MTGRPDPDAFARTLAALAGDGDGAPDPADAAWIARCAQRMVACDRFLELEQAIGVAHALSANPALRTRGPERVAEDCLRTGGRWAPGVGERPARSVAAAPRRAA